MIKYLLDTNVISEPLKPMPNENVMRKLEIHQAEIATASPVWHELQFGCKRLPVSRKRTEIELFLSEVVWPTLEIFTYDESAAEWHAVQRALLCQAGKAPSFVDGQIAAIAKVNQLILVTRNISDYLNFSEIEIENWHNES